jgi:hypothetical protein
VAIWVEHPSCEIVGVILKLWPRHRLDACPCRNRGIKEFSHFGLALGGESDVNCVWSGFSFLEPEEVPPVGTKPLQVRVAIFAGEVQKIGDAERP